MSAITSPASEPEAVRCTCGLGGACDGKGTCEYPCNQPEAVLVARAWPQESSHPATIMARHILAQHVLAKPLDNCQFCLGARGGVPGNANLVGGVTCCDDCSVLVGRVTATLTAERDKLREGLRAAVARFGGLLEIFEDKGGPLEHDRELLAECQRRLQGSDGLVEPRSPGVQEAVALMERLAKPDLVARVGELEVALVEALIEWSAMEVSIHGPRRDRIAALRRLVAGTVVEAT